MTRGSRSRRGSAWFVVLVLTVCALVALPVQAQSGAADKAAAEALFDEGVALLQKGDYEAACKKLEDSERVDPGIGTLLYLADCYERLGKTASAWATFRAAASMAQNAGQNDRARAGMERADSLEPKLVRLTVEVAAETKSLEGLTITRGAEQVPLTLLGMAVPVDPGTHEVVASAPGYLPFKVMVTVDATQANQTVSVPALEVDPNAPAKAAEEEPAATAGPEESTKPKGPRGRTQRTVGLVLAGAGVIGLGVGSVFGLVAIDENNRAVALGCNGGACSTDEGAALGNAAFDHATLSTVFFVAGGALLATGAVVYLVAPRDPKETLAVTRVRVAGLPGGMAVSLGGTF